MIAEDDVAGINRDSVTSWLLDNVEGAEAPFRFDIIAGGHSNLTYRVVAGDGSSGPISSRMSTNSWRASSSPFTRSSSSFSVAS